MIKLINKLIDSKKEEEFTRVIMWKEKVRSLRKCGDSISREFSKKQEWGSQSFMNHFREDDRQRKSSLGKQGVCGFNIQLDRKLILLTKGIVTQQYSKYLSIVSQKDHDPFYTGWGIGEWKKRRGISFRKKKVTEEDKLGKRKRGKERGGEGEERRRRDENRDPLGVLEFIDFEIRKREFQDSFSYYLHSRRD